MPFIICFYAENLSSILDPFMHNHPQFMNEEILFLSSIEDVIDAIETIDMNQTEEVIVIANGTPDLLVPLTCRLMQWSFTKAKPQQITFLHEGKVIF